MVGSPNSFCRVGYSLGTDESLVADSVLNHRSVVKIRHAKLVIPKVRMIIWSPDWVRGLVSKPRSLVKIRYAKLVIPRVRMEIRSQILSRILGRWSRFDMQS